MRSLGTTGAEETFGVGILQEALDQMNREIAKTSTIGLMHAQKMHNAEHQCVALYYQCAGLCNKTDILKRITSFNLSRTDR